jgi:hypothetical protein
MHRVFRVAMVIALCSGSACTGNPPPTASSSGRAPTATASSGNAATAGQVGLDCSGPIGTMPSPTGSHRGILDVVSLDTTSTVQASAADGADPHRLFAKTGLLVHAGHEGDLTVPKNWATRVSITWGNHAPQWTTGLHIPACPAPPGASGQWLAFPGGFSLDKAACVPLQVRVAQQTTTVHIPVGVPCRG